MPRRIRRIRQTVLQHKENLEQRLYAELAPGRNLLDQSLKG